MKGLGLGTVEASGGSEHEVIKYENEGKSGERAESKRKEGTSYFISQHCQDLKVLMLVRDF